MTTPGLADAARVLSDAVLTALRAVPNLTVYDSDVDTAPPLDPDGRVHPYAVVYAGPGRAYPTSLAGDPRDMAWTFQVTAVGGDRARCLWAVARVRGTLTGQRFPDPDGYPLAELLDEARVQPDRDVTPPRFYVPVVYAGHATG